MSEEWRPVVGQEGVYEVSNWGHVRSVERMITTKAGWRRRVPTKVLSTHVQVEHDLRCVVQLTVGGKNRSCAVGVLVLEAWVEPKPSPEMICLHWDDDPWNNHVENLRWGTHSDNRYDSVRNGGHHQTKKTQCPQGHEYDAENTRMYQGRRYCRRCDGWTGR